MDCELAKLELYEMDSAVLVIVFAVVFARGVESAVLAEVESELEVENDKEAHKRKSASTDVSRTQTYDFKKPSVTAQGVTNHSLHELKGSIPLSLSLSLSLSLTLSLSLSLYIHTRASNFYSISLLFLS